MPGENANGIVERQHISGDINVKTAWAAIGNLQT